MVVPIDKLRTYAELIIPKIQLYFKEYEPEDEYRIFFPKNKKEHRKKIKMFRCLLIESLYSFFKTSINRVDLALVFRYKSSVSIQQAINSVNHSEKRLISLKKEVSKVLETIECNQWSTPKNHVLVSKVIDSNEWQGYIPKVQMGYADAIFNALRTEPECGLTREEITSSRSSRRYVLARKVFVWLFLEKYPDANRKFLVYILNRNNHVIIVRIIKNLHDYTNPKISHLDYVKEFQNLVEKIKTRCESERP